MLAAAVFFVACVSDFLDGYLARRRGLSTTLGKLLDPLADKLIVAAALIMLAAMPREPRVPAWMVVVVVGRDLAVTGLRAIALGEGVVLAAEELGKYKMIFLIFALHGLIIHYRVQVVPGLLVIDFHLAGMLLLWMAMLLGVWSAADYHVKVLRRMAAGAPGGVAR